MTIERELKAAKDRLRYEVVEAAAARAEKMVADNMKDQDQDKMVEEFIDRVENLH